MTTRIALIETLKKYRSDFTEEEDFKAKFLHLLAHDRAFHRDHLPGHVTGSAWIVDKTKRFVLLTHHAKLNRWLQPGGHADGDENIKNVALREAHEETGLKALRLVHSSILDIDIHPIPKRKGFPQHDHYDIRFLVEASMEEPFIITAESHDLRWVAAEELPALTGNNRSMIRMAEKVNKLF